MVQALDAERFHLTPPLNQMRVWGHSAEDKWFLPLLHLLNAGYPSPREELVEEALRKIACDRLKGVYLDDGAGVQFTLYELKKELRERGHDINSVDLVESLKICNLTNISIQTADGKAIIQSPIFPTLLIASREDWLAEPKHAKCYVQFN